MSAAGIREHSVGDAEALAAAVAARIAERLRAGIAARGVARLALSGGRSPIAMFTQLAQAELDWSRVTITLVDERWVAVDHADSNERLLRDHLLVGPVAQAGFVGLKTSAATAAEALAERSARLQAQLLPLDVAVLGMGEDGHTASLFPGAAGLADALAADGEAVLAAIDPPAAPHARISLTIAALLASRHLLLPIAGAAKQAVYARARDGASAFDLPVAAVLQQSRVPVDVYIGA